MVQTGPFQGGVGRTLKTDNSTEGKTIWYTHTLN